ncbi:SpoIID/LytB domain protein [Synechococcus sp. PCC 7502]|uniref:SpoIID/LytB domain-containing protein n=1 Tax=Synechococcus sp. PCC 7502 TaxID=1173263 RepID=UPI00029FC482|nr:SpoIID/LytB domain-containing protein [Synechococcus sp. PCC 7502]AFY73494.1 SpoIID/LytB domain protein [Synechococcus sp. PCC 7502]
MIKKVFLSLCVCLISANLGAAANAAILRVLIKEEADAQMPVAVTQPATLTTGNNSEPITLNPGKWYFLPRTQVNLIQPSNNGLTQIGDRLYPGNIEIRSWNSKAIAVNILPLEEYLRSVVPSEMPASWHLDALKAQAVAARSYAINTQKQRKWGTAPYDLVSDTRDQVYSGFFKFDPKQPTPVPVIHQNSDLAVVETAGYVLRDGFKGYYRASLPVSWINWGNGFMPVSDGKHLDQKISQQMAQRGWNWVQILAWWYRDEPVKP